ncbi:ATP-binding protein [Pseudomonas syringae pv. syringae]|uniref:ATP-binding protein n=1 Tax=Pseudomonas syringae TaxID=317 RepID=UPI00200B66F4|nr:ATP-binding protein [Pseudomonas syringae]MCK9759830.1 ATP-binding protein [Pseudomonas syringae pv. syringae]MCK9774821.1 ATP-binding protein [Pseudomonas syringae pv. syringae]
MSKFVHWVENVITTASRFTISRDLPDYCDLQTIIRLTKDDLVLNPQLKAPYIMVTDEGDYCTMYSIAGSFCDTDENAPAGVQYSWAGRLLRMTERLTASYRKHGHKISLVFESDPDRGGEEVDALLAPQYRSIGRTGINMKEILDENRAKLAPWVSRERCYLVCYSGRQSLSQQELIDENKRLNKLIEASPAARYGQNPVLAEMAGLKIRHDAFLSVVAQALADSGEGVLLELMDAHAAGHALRSQVDRQGTPAAWQPLLPDDEIMPHGVRQGDDHTPFLAPWLKFQLLNPDVHTLGNKICVNGMWHGTLSVELGPQAPASFSKLKALIPREVPWRVRMDVMPGGMKSLGGKKGMLDFMAFVPPLRPVWTSISKLSEKDKTEPVCVMTIMASTWGGTPEAVTRNLTLLKQAFEAWGICSVTQTFGDPVKAWTATLVASSKGCGMHLLYPPLSTALSFLPLTRPASGWEDDGNALFPTLDGKLYPVGLATSKQNKLTNIICGSPGLGKSVLLNKLGNCQITSAQQSLPFFAGVDKGFSMQGQIALLQDSLPEGRKDEVIGVVLQNDRKHCRNLFDIQLGASFPIAPERSWIMSMMTAMCTDPGIGAPPNQKDTRSILDRIITLAYKTNAEYSPRAWVKGLIPEIDRALEKSRLYERYEADWWESAKWYEVRDLLFEAGHVSEAQRAQFQAVPELADMTTYLNDQNVQRAYGKVQRDDSHELLIDYLRRCLTDACEEYRMLAGRTQFVISPRTRVIAIDLNNVMGDNTQSGHLRTGLMFLFAGQVAGGDFVLPQYKDELLSSVLPLYHALHKERLEQLDQEVKTKVYDELHNASQANFIFPMLETQDREMRKFGIRTVLCSQYVRDFPATILRAANSLFMMEVDPQDEAMLSEHFKVPKVTIRNFQRMGSGPSQDGSGVPFLGVFRMKGGNTLARLLKNAMGPLELWSLNSSSVDSALRKILYEQVGGKTGRSILATEFPNGTAEKLIALRQRQVQDPDATNVTRTLANELIAKRGNNI